MKKKGSPATPTEESLIMLGAKYADEAYANATRIFNEAFLLGCKFAREHDAKFNK